MMCSSIQVAHSFFHLKHPGLSASLGPGQAKSCCHQIRKAEHLVEEGSECVYHLPHSKMNIALKSQWQGILKLWSRVSPGENLSCIEGHCPWTDCLDFRECEWVSFVLTSSHRFILTAVSNWIPLKIYSFSTANSLTQGFSNRDLGHPVLFIPSCSCSYSLEFLTLPSSTFL